MPSRFYASFDGNLTSDVKFGKTRKGDRKAEFTIAHSSYLTDENGDRRDDAPTKFFRCITTDKQIVASLERNETIGKGTRMSVSGTIQFDDFINRDQEVQESNNIFIDNIGVDLRFSNLEWSKSEKKRRSRDDDEEDERPRRKSRRDREEEDEEDERPRRKPTRRNSHDEDEETEKPRRKPATRKSREEEDEEDERPRRKSAARKPREDDDDEEPRTKKRASSRKVEDDDEDNWFEED